MGDICYQFKSQKVNQGVEKGKLRKQCMEKYRGVDKNNQSDTDMKIQRVHEGCLHCIHYIGNV